MKQYKGYYIDHVIFHNTAEIDNFIKEQLVNRFKSLNQLFVTHSSIEYSIACEEVAEQLRKQYGFSWEELEQLEIEAMQTA